MIAIVRVGFVADPVHLLLDQYHLTVHIVDLFVEGVSLVHHPQDHEVLWFILDLLVVDVWWDVVVHGHHVLVHPLVFVLALVLGHVLLHVVVVGNVIFVKDRGIGMAMEEEGVEGEEEEE